MANPIQAIIQSGVNNDASQSQNRSIVFSNCIALILAIGGLLLFALVPQNHNRWGLFESLISVAVFTLPILLNRMSLYRISILYLCWVPPLLISWVMITGMSAMEVVPISSYSGFKIYIIATSCIPYLLMDNQNKFSFVVGILPSFLMLAFNDYILDITGIGHAVKGAPDARYSFIQARSLIAYVVIGGSCLSLRLIVNKSDKRNSELIAELDKKNRTILERAAKEVSDLDNKLYEKLEELRERDYRLNERVKELTTIKLISQLLNKDDESADNLLMQIVNIIPPGWQYPEITAARIAVENQEFKTSNFTEGVDKQSADFYLPEGVKGTIDVVYLQKKPMEAEGPFLPEERNLINLIAEMLRIYFTKRHDSLALKNSEASLRATMNNTDILIWSVDPDLKLTSFNKPFFDHIKKYYNIEVKVGLLGASQRSDDVELAKKWKASYQAALSGKKITAEETRFGIDFHYSLVPIIEEQRIVGVNVFATNITSQKEHARELAEANKQIGELKLTALRSVMNPHFIFNALNSIQFFIAANDRLNAINYLSKFSKLIRSILTSSVNNKIKLADEIEILRNYIQLEMVRFEGKFEFRIEIDPALEINDIEIPSLLVQPYVENAILHGLYNKQDKGFLLIKIYEQKECVVFEIEDDGVGRVIASKIRERNLSGHVSMGTKLTEERLKLINESHNVSFQTTDLIEGDPNPGTRVKIWIKV